MDLGNGAALRDFDVNGLWSEYAAVPINEDVDICAICNMQVKDDAFATQLTTKDGKTSSSMTLAA